MLFEQVIGNLRSNISFEPKYKFKDLAFDFDDEFLKYHCYNKGKYCAISDAYVDSISELDEAIRQKCIWKLSNTEEALKDIWWDYILNYRTCLKDKLSTSGTKVIDCYQSIISRMKLTQPTQTAIDKCYNESFSAPGDKYLSINNILEKDVNSMEYNSVYLVPAFFVNSNLVKEDLQVKLIVSAICDSLITRPSFCQEYLSSNITFNYPESTSYKQTIILIVSLVTLGVIVIALMIFYVKRRMSRNVDEEIESQIKSHVTEYMRLRDSQNDSKL